MLTYVYDELTDCVYLVQDDELPYLIAEKLKQLPESELRSLLGDDTLSKFRRRFIGDSND